MAYTAPLNPTSIAAPAGGTIGIAAFTGAATSAPTVSATTVLSGAANLALRGTPTITRNGVGDVTYTLAVSASPAVAYAVLPVVAGTTDLIASLQSQAVTSGALVVRVLTTIGDGTATDMTTADVLRLVVIGTSTNV